MTGFGENSKQETMSATNKTNYEMQGKPKGKRKYNDKLGPLVCPICFEGFYESIDVETHMYKHSKKDLIENLMSYQTEDNVVSGLYDSVVLPLNGPSAAVPIRNQGRKVKLPGKKSKAIPNGELSKKSRQKKASDTVNTKSLCEMGKDLELDIDSMEFTCEICQAEFVDYSLFETHVQSHEENNSLPTLSGPDKCLGTHSSSPRSAVDNDTGSDGSTVLMECHICYEKFTDLAKLNYHMNNTHTNDLSAEKDMETENVGTLDNPESEATSVCDVMVKTEIPDDIQTSVDTPASMSGNLEHQRSTHLGTAEGAMNQLRCPVCKEVLENTDEFLKHMDGHSSTSTGNAGVPNVVEDVAGKVKSQVAFTAFKDKLERGKHVSEARVDRTHAEIGEESSSEKMPGSPSLEHKHSATSLPLKRKRGRPVLPEKKEPERKRKVIILPPGEKPQVYVKRVKNSVSTESSNIYFPHEGSQYPCRICDKGFVSVFDLRLHMYSHPGEKAFICDKCNAGFDTLTKLKEHMLSKHGADSQPLKCQLCNKQFRDGAKLGAHMYFHTGSLPYTCRICKQGFSLSTQLKAHEKTHMDDYDPLKCDVCREKFEAKLLLENHKKEASGKQKLQCVICRKVVCTKSQLETHLASHGSKAFRCPKCPKGFSSDKQLRYHLLVHSVVRPFACEYCDEKFWQRRLLFHHMYSEHENEQEDSGMSALDASGQYGNVKSEDSAFYYNGDDSDEDADFKTKIVVKEEPVEYTE